MVRALPLLLLFLSPAWWLPLSLAAAGEEGGDGCSPEFCGKVNISYPFEVVKEVRAETTPCGAPGFQVLCNRTTTTPVLGYTRRWSLSFEILDVFYGNASLRVADLQARHGFNTSAGLEGCHVPAENVSGTFGPPFWISASNQNLIFYNCTKPPAAARWPELQLVETKCRGNTFARVGGSHSYGDVDQGDYYLEGCNATFVPVLGADGQANASSYEQLIRDGFLLTWPPPPPPTSSGSHNIKLIVSLSTTLSLLFICLICTMYHQKQKLGLCILPKKTSNKSSMEEILKSYESLAPKRYRYSQLKKLTRSFKDKLGEGGFGTVFRGSLQDGRVVAVKLLKGSKSNGEEFLNEVISIGRTSHINVVSLLGFCLEGPKRALVYEYMANGSLERYIYSYNSKQVICCEKLQQIAVGIARGLEYLHQGCSTRIIHFDIKPHNILLDQDFCPKIADFGLAKLCHLKDSILSMAEARGTIGFIAPEVFYRSFGVVSTKSDVYSYGMMLLEMVGGKISKENTGNSSDVYFPNWIYHCLVKELQSCEVVCGIAESERKMAKVGLWCIQTIPGNRPSMSKVIDMLGRNINELEMPPKPFLSCPSIPSHMSP